MFGLLLANDLGAYPAETWTAAKVLVDRRIAAGMSVQSLFHIPIHGAKAPFIVQAALLHRRARPDAIQAYDLPEDVYGYERKMAEAEIRVP